jgi:hypothetical protein
MNSFAQIEKEGSKSFEMSLQILQTHRRGHGAGKVQEVEVLTWTTGQVGSVNFAWDVLR